MALIFTGTDSNGVTVTGNNDTYVTRYFDVVSNEGDGFSFSTFDNTEYFVDGSIYATAIGITSSRGASSLDVVVGTNGSVVGASSGISLRGDNTADFNQSVFNNGSIVGTTGAGVDIVAAGSAVTNNGFISGAGTGIYLLGNSNSAFNSGTVSSATSSGIELLGDFAEIYNHGSVTGGFHGLVVIGDYGEIVNTDAVTAPINGLAMFGFGNITNSGVVTAGSDAVFFSHSTGEVSTFSNNGTITSNGLDADDHAIDGSFGDDLVTNSGTVNGTIELDRGADKITNSGEINGDTGVGDDNDTITNSGEINGAITLGSGDDVYQGALGSVTGAVSGGAGSDLLVGGAEDNVLQGGAGADTLRGKHGDDTLAGNNGADLLNGGFGDDVIYGGFGGDEIRGARGDDILTGGNGSDTFVFARKAEDDIVTDFENGVDTFDVSAFGLAGFGALSAGVSNAGGDALIDWTVFGGEGLLIIEGAAGQLNAADFIF